MAVLREQISRLRMALLMRVWKHDHRAKVVRFTAPSAQSLVLEPYDLKKIIFTHLPAGRFEFVFEHNDTISADDSSGLRLHLSAPGIDESLPLDVMKGVHGCNLRYGQFISHDPRGYITITIESQIDHTVRLNEIRLNHSKKSAAKTTHCDTSKSCIGGSAASKRADSAAENFGKNLCIAAHDFKFIDAFVSRQKDLGRPVRLDRWFWGGAGDFDRSYELLDWADVLLCEWGLANAAWFSQHNIEKKPLFIRMHAQETRGAARRFGAAVNIERVTKVIFVSERVRQEAITLWAWPENKTTVISNYVMTDAFMLGDKPRVSNEITIGLAGFVPWAKRLDRAIDTLEALQQAGRRARLRVKGRKPEDQPLMQSAARTVELDAYHAVYARINASEILSASVDFDPWGDDMAQWYGGIDAILSCSDHESFHYALADGVLSGCLPIVWPWDGAEKVYTPEWIVADAQEAASRIITFADQKEQARREALLQNRHLVEQRYGAEKIFTALEGILC